MSELPKVNEETILLKLLRVMINNKTNLVLVTREDKGLGMLSLEDVFLYMIESGRRLIDILNMCAGDLMSFPKYVLNFEADHDELRRVILKMEAYEPILVVKNGSFVAAVTLKDMLLSLSFIKPLLHRAIVRSRRLGTLVAPNTSLKGCISKMIEDKSKHAVVHRKGRVLGLISYLNIVNCLVSSDTLEHIRLGVDGYFFYTTCSTVMERNFKYLIVGDYSNAYQILADNEYLIVLDDDRSRRLVKFISSNSAFILLREALKRHL